MSPESQYIIVSGIPASGKSSLGRALSDALKIVMFDKDDLLERLFDERGVGDAKWRSELSRTADELLCERVKEVGTSVIVSWWRHPRSTRASGTSIEWLSQLRGKIVEVYCRCDPAIAARRFSTRTRHPGHLDVTKSLAQLTEEFAYHAALGPLGVGPLVEVNTEESVDVMEVVSRLKTHDRLLD